ncbi:unnamed protein product [Miscanthus lutarioriparius]|uniref:Uncharacterized protein n=1 Tax=Miscanthus lutarioriparius TaxID=422564 RepID=A0A811NAF4_9POAL|nr:unnamed protein product [Miscanthus lutarioriparius]
MEFVGPGEISDSIPDPAGFDSAAHPTDDGVPPPAAAGATEDLDLNSQAPDLDFGMSFGELLRSHTAGAVGGSGQEVAGVGRGCAIPSPSTTATRRVAPIPTKSDGGTASAARPYQLPRRARPAIRATTTAPSAHNGDHHHRVSRGEGDEGGRPPGGRRRGVRGRPAHDSAIIDEDEAALAHDSMILSNHESQNLGWCILDFKLIGIWLLEVSFWNPDGSERGLRQRSPDIIGY